MFTSSNHRHLFGLFLTNLILFVEKGIGETEGTKHDLHQAILRDESVARLHELGKLVEDSMVKLDRICREASVKLVFVRSYGLAGFVRVSVKEHTIIDSKPNHFLDDLHLNNPWPELKSFVETIDLNVSDHVAHKHIPYVVILVKMADEWNQSHSGNLPTTREEKKEFKDLVKSKIISMDEDNYKEAIEAAFKVFAPRGISSEIQQISNDSCAVPSSNSSDFG